MKDRLKHWFLNSSIFTRTALLTAATVILVCTVSTAFLLSEFSRNINEKDRLLVSEATAKIHSYMKAKYNLMYNQRTLIHSTRSIAGIIAGTRSNPSAIYEAGSLSRITDYLTAVNYSDDTILDSVIFTSDGKNAFSRSASKTRDISLSYDFNSLPYIRDFLDSDLDIIAVCEPEPAYLLASTPEDGQGVITFAAKIYDNSHPTKRSVLGYMMINLSPGSILNTYSEIEHFSNGYYYVVNSGSSVIYSNDDSILNQPLDSLSIRTEDIIFSKPVGISGIQVIGVVSGSTLQSEINKSIFKMTAITAAGILCMIMAVTFLHKHYRGKFGRLSAAMENITGGGLKIRLPVSSRDEIGCLSASFNTMCETLDTYIQKTYVAETSRRTAELYALQAQINPHFLFNTIESIRMKAVSDGNLEVSDMLAKLGSLFRWMIHFSHDIVYLEDEAEYIESYLELQTLRFGERVQVDIDIPSSTLYLGIPRFTLQPIVENAIKHGLGSGSSALEVTIKIRAADGQLCIVVEDNGLGMDENTLLKLRAHISGKEPCPGFGVALWNVHKRIQMLFGESYGLNIKSAPYIGTHITVTMPTQPKKEMEQNVQNDHSG